MSRNIRTYGDREPETERDAVIMNIKLKQNSNHVAKRQHQNTESVRALLTTTLQAGNEMIEHLFHPKENFKRIDIHSIPDL